MRRLECGKLSLSSGTGLFVTFEGGEGAGKSTQIRRLAEALKGEGHDVLVTREPGGSPGAEAVRHVLLSGAAEAFGTRMEAILFAAARNDHVEEAIRPALASGKVVLCDRFMDSSRVYQGITGNLEPDFIETLQRIAINGVMPDCTVILDIPAKVGLERAQKRAAADGPDRFEKSGSKRTRNGARPFSISPPANRSAATWSTPCRRRRRSPPRSWRSSNSCCRPQAVCECRKPPIMSEAHYE